MYVSVCVVRRVHVVDRSANSGAGRSRGHAAGCSRARGGGHGGAPGRRCAADDSDSEDVASFQRVILVLIITITKLSNLIGYQLP